MKRSRARKSTRALRRRGAAAQMRLGVWREREVVVDLFAGGGGASEGISRALGRHPDIAINHDPAAIAMHAANHPSTTHFCESVFRVTPRDVVGGRPVGLLWASPDCTHFSKSKGGKPRSKKIRGLAWVVVRWAKEVGPRVIALENVEEFADWGPLGPDARPDKARAGKTFRAFCSKLRQYGYVVEHRILVAADYGAPTTRKRLFLIARRDGVAITWPEATHAKNGRGARRWRAAAEIIDWSLPCPSIFDRKRPLADPTLRRIAVGTRRYVIDAAKPFIVPVTHPRDARVHGIDEPVRTITGANRGELALVAPSFVRTDMQSDGHLRGIAGPEEPLRTITSAGGHAVVEPLLTPFVLNNMTNNVPRPVEAPLATILSGNHKFLVAPTLVTTGHGERTGQAPRVPGLDKPLGTVVATAQNHALVAAFLAKHYGGVVGHGLDRAIGTVTAQDHHALTTALLTKFYGTSVGASVGSPLHTITAQGSHHALTAAWLMRYNGQGVGTDPRDPLATVTARDRFAAVVALLARFAEGVGPFVVIDGELWVIVDIGMRMLVPRELFRAQGFRDDYVIDPMLERPLRRGGVLRLPLTKTEQIAKAGNSVCPPLAEAIVRANFRERLRAAA